MDAVSLSLALAFCDKNHKTHSYFKQDLFSATWLQVLQYTVYDK